MKLTTEQKAQRASERTELRRIKKLQQQEHAERYQKEIAHMYFNIKWKKSRTWNFTPKLTTQIRYKDGSSERSKITFTCFGAGYDKQNCVLAQAFNYYLLYQLWKYHDAGKKECISFCLPSKSWNFPYYTESGQYAKMFELLGGKFEHVASTPNYDRFELSLERSPA